MNKSMSVLNVLLFMAVGVLVASLFSADVFLDEEVPIDGPVPVEKILRFWRPGLGRQSFKSFENEHGRIVVQGEMRLFPYIDETGKEPSKIDVKPEGSQGFHYITCSFDAPDLLQGVPVSTPLMARQKVQLLIEGEFSPKKPLGGQFMLVHCIIKDQKITTTPFELERQHSILSELSGKE